MRLAPGTLGPTACRISGRYVMHSTNAVGRYSMHAGTLSIDCISPSFFMAPSLPVTGQRWSGCVFARLAQVRLVCDLILPVVLLISRGAP